LCGGSFSWIPRSNGNLSPRPFGTGNANRNFEYYVGRGWIGGSLAPGKILPRHGCLYVGFGGTEYCLKNYEAANMN
jgi:hypothetical protein